VGWLGLMTGLTERPPGRGFGKLILFGEHAVVYGVPAIVASLRIGASATLTPAAQTSLNLMDDSGRIVASAAPLENGTPLERAFCGLIASLGATDDFQVNVTLEVPMGVGMGSSAAMAASVARAFAGRLGLSDEAVQSAVAASEAVFHGSASGIDQAAALTGGVFSFERGTPPRMSVIQMQPVEIVVIEAGPPALTSDMVNGVALRLQRRKKAGPLLLSAIRELVDEAIPALRAGDWSSVAELMEINHGLLKALGVSTPALDAACADALAAGALGAKITGAGGGGCVIALVPKGAESVCDTLIQQGWKAFRVEIR
jgi:mevalonate kinase